MIWLDHLLKDLEPMKNHFKLALMLSLFASPIIAQQAAAPAAQQPEQKPIVYKHISKEMQEELKQFFLSFFKENAEVVAQTFEEGMQTAQYNKIKKISESLATNKDKLVTSNGTITLGNKDAKVKLVVFLDPNCRHCKGFYSEVLPKILAAKHQDFAVVLWYWAFMGEGSEAATQILHAAYQQGADKFESVAMKYAKDTQLIDKERAWKLAEGTKADIKKLKETADSEPIKKIVVDAKNMAEKEIGLPGTPFMVLSTPAAVNMMNTMDPNDLNKYIKEALSGNIGQPAAQVAPATPAAAKAS